MNRGNALVVLALMLWALPALGAKEPEIRISKASQSCIACHRIVTPGIVEDWNRSRHSKSTPEMGMRKPPLEKRISAATVPENLADTAVGCAECHLLNADAHPDTFDHNGFRVHVIVTPRDCRVCHPEEAEQYGRNPMAWAHTNLEGNPIYHDLEQASLATPRFKDGRLALEPPSRHTEEDACYFCHGTVVEVEGMEERQTSMGKMTFPRLSGWPNQGVGRLNPDGTRGGCASCHARHQFSIEVARQPATCSECHKGPDVPAYPVYEVSKHGNIYNSMKEKWDFSAVPWTTGKDFNAPTCAECHASLVVSGTGQILAERTHQFSDRLAWRIFGLPYAHPQPKSPDTRIIRNAAGQPLPTTLDGKFASDYLIDPAEQQKRTARMQQVCSGCHGRGWIEGHFARYHDTIRATNEHTLEATRIIQAAWDEGLADPKGNLFDEGIEKMWTEQWFFYANSTRFASAMAGADYGTFAEGRWYMNRNLAEMADRYKLLKSAGEKR